MNPAIEQQVREHAYQIWIKNGMVHGLAHEHWIAAERTLLGETPSKPQKAKAAAPRPKAAKPVATAAKPVKAKAASAKPKAAAAKPVKAKAASVPRVAKARGGATDCAAAG